MNNIKYLSLKYFKITISSILLKIVFGHFQFFKQDLSFLKYSNLNLFID